MKDKRPCQYPNPTNPAFCQVWQKQHGPQEVLSGDLLSDAFFFHIFFLFNDVCGNESEPVNERQLLSSLQSFA